MATLADVEGAIKTALTGDTGAGGVNTLTGGRIWHLLPHSSDRALPMVLYSCTDDAQAIDFSADTMECEYTITVHGELADGADTLRTISDRVRTVLHRQDITTGSLTQCNCMAQGWGLPDASEDGITITTRYKVWAQ